MTVVFSGITGKSQNDYTRQILVAFAAMMVIFNSCIHTGWPAPSIPKLQTVSYAFPLTSNEGSAVLMIGFIGDIIGGFIMSFLIDRIGRQRTLLLMSIPQLVSLLLIYLSFIDKSFLYIARVLGGISEGCYFCLCSLYISEVVSPDIRGALGVGTMICGHLGFMFVNTVGSFFSLYNTALIVMLFPLTFMVICTRLPETPYYLLMKNRSDEAERVLKFLLNKNNVKKELASLSSDVARQMSESGSYRDLFTIKSNRLALTCMIVTRMMQQYSGCTAIGFYVQVLLENSIPSLTPLLSSSMMLGAQLVMIICSTFLVDRYGRKILLITSISGCCIALFLSAIYFTIRDWTTIDVSTLQILPLIFLIAYEVLFSAGLQSLVTLLVSEMFSASVKGKAVCVINVVFSLTALSSLRYYQFMSINFGMAVPFYSFAFVTSLGIVFFKFALPETKGKTLEEIQQILKSKGRRNQALPDGKA